MTYHCVPDSAPCPAWSREATLDDLACIQRLGNRVHWHKKRKVQQQNSYWSHPALTAGLVAKVGGGLRATCIAVGHDVVEEGGIEMLDVLRQQLPCSVWRPIWMLTPPPAETHLTWHERKTHVLSRMAGYQDTDVALVAAADKCATLYDMNCDIDNLGVETVWHRMKAWNKPLLWYYEEAANVLRDKIPAELAAIYERELNGFRQRQPTDWSLSVGG